MKSLAFFTLFLLFVHLSLQIPQLINCPPDFELTDSMKDGCGTLTCDGPYKQNGVGCGTWQCGPGREIGYKPSNNSLPYPDCCGGPICSEHAIIHHLELE